MKKYLKLIVCALAVMLVGCDENNYNTPQLDTNEYYVRYTVTAQYHNRRFGNVVYADVDGTKKDLIGEYKNSWTVTIGPVKKGFRASVKNETGSYATNTIEVCKNGGPFALKATGTDGASYIIDF